MSHQDPKQIFKSMVSFVIVLLVVIFILAGCTAVVPVTAKFPERPAGVEKCLDLQKLNDSAKLSDVSTTINDNYAEHYKCAVKVDTWNEWYEAQKRIFEKVK